MSGLNRKTTQIIPALEGIFLRIVSTMIQLTNAPLLITHTVPNETHWKGQLRDNFRDIMSEDKEDNLPVEIQVDNYGSSTSVDNSWRTVRQSR